jgi:hypothetical protein
MYLQTTRAFGDRRQPSPDDNFAKVLNGRKQPICGPDRHGVLQADFQRGPGFPCGQPKGSIARLITA